MSQVFTSGAGVVTTDYPKDTNLQTRMLALVRVTPVASEVVAIKHGDDIELTRRIQVLELSSGLEEVDGGTNVASRAKIDNVGLAGADSTQENTTVITFQAAAAGKEFVVIIEF